MGDPVRQAGVGRRTGAGRDRLIHLRARRLHKLSGGQQQRAQLAMALVADPALLVLDEPTAGLDVTSRRAFWRVLAIRRARGAAVLLTTHQIAAAAATADRVIVLHEGRVVAEDTPMALTSQLPVELRDLRAPPGLKAHHPA